MTTNDSDNNTIMQIAEQISQSIFQQTEGLLDYKINQAPFDKTYSGIISEILFDPETKVNDLKFGTYKIRYNNIEQKIKLNDGIVHEVGERVQIYVPENNSNRAIVEPVIKEHVPCKIIYHDDKGELVFNYETTINQQLYKVERKYQIEFKDRGTQQEKVTKIITPEGRRIELEGV